MHNAKPRVFDSDRLVSKPIASEVTRVCGLQAVESASKTGSMFIDYDQVRHVSKVIMSSMFALYAKCLLSDSSIP